jgi:hypothetical protein
MGIYENPTANLLLHSERKLSSSTEQDKDVLLAASTQHCTGMFRPEQLERKKE